MSCLSLLHVRGLPESPAGQNRLHALNTLVDLTGTEQVGGPSANAAGNVKDHNAHVAVTTISEQTSALHVMNAISMQIVLGQDMVKEWHGLKECARAAVANSCACLLTFQLLTLQVCAAGALLSILHREGLLRSSPSASLAAPDRNDASLAGQRAQKAQRSRHALLCGEPVRAAPPGPPVCGLGLHACPADLPGTPRFWVLLISQDAKLLMLAGSLP